MSNKGFKLKYLNKNPQLLQKYEKLQSDNTEFKETLERVKLDHESEFPKIIKTGLPNIFTYGTKKHSCFENSIDNSQCNNFNLFTNQKNSKNIVFNKHYAQELERIRFHSLVNPKKQKLKKLEGKSFDCMLNNSYFKISKLTHLIDYRTMNESKGNPSRINESTNTRIVTIQNCGTLVNESLIKQFYMKMHKQQRIYTPKISSINSRKEFLRISRSYSNLQLNDSQIRSLRKFCLKSLKIKKLHEQKRSILIRGI